MGSQPRLHSAEMSTSSTGQMLAEIECGTGLQAINAVRYNTSPPGPLFIPQLDDVLLPYRSSTHSSTLQRGDMIEVVGASGSGKTTFLNFLLLTTLLPYSFPLPITSSAPHPITLGGQSQSAALLCSSSSRSPIPLLAQAIRSHIIDSVSSVVSTVGPSRLTPAMTAAIDLCLKETLDRLKVIKVKARYRYWTLALRSLEYPAEMSEGAGKEGSSGLSLVCLDGLSQCFWPERYAEEERSSNSARKKAGSVPGIRGIEDIGMKDVMDAVGTLRKDMGCVVVTTTQGLWHEKKPETSQPTLLYASYLPHPYPSPWSIRPGEDVPDPPSDHLPTSTAYPTQPSTPSRPVKSAHWPLTFQLNLLGRARGLQYPTDMMLSEAMMARDKSGGGGERYIGRVRMRGVEGPLGGRAGVEWGFGVGKEGLEVITD